MTTETAPSVTAFGSGRKPSVGRLTAVELRKMTDTRAGFWLLVVEALITIGAVAAQLATGNGAGRDLASMFQASLMPTSILLPVLGILSVTSEWSQRTALTTFTLVPTRWRTLAGKLLAGTVVAAIAAGVCLVTAALGNVLVGTLIAGSGTWTVTATSVGYGFLYLLFGVVMGMAFGLLCMNSPMAIVLYFLIPTVWTVLGQFVSGLHDAREWLDQSVTITPLTTGAMTAESWLRVAATAAVWLLLPLIAGLIRLTRREVS